MLNNPSLKWDVGFFFFKKGKYRDDILFKSSMVVLNSCCVHAVFNKKGLNDNCKWGASTSLYLIADFFLQDICIVFRVRCERWAWNCEWSKRDKPSFLTLGWNWGRSDDWFYFFFCIRVNFSSSLKLDAWSYLHFPLICVYSVHLLFKSLPCCLQLKGLALLMH